jgi:hypothetical protein
MKHLGAASKKGNVLKFDKWWQAVQDSIAAPEERPRSKTQITTET